MELISREQAIEALSELATFTDEWSEHTWMYTDDVYGAIKQLSPIQPEPYWIPVTERLPEESGLYQVTDMQGHVVRYVFNANESSVEYWRRCVKAWMPLPESYKGD